MADFLSRLAERSLGTAAVARPVIAPLFATGPDLAPDEAATEDGSETAGLRRPPPPALGLDGPESRPPATPGARPDLVRAHAIDARTLEGPDVGPSHRLAAAPPADVARDQGRQAATSPKVADLPPLVPRPRSGLRESETPRPRPRPLAPLPSTAEPQPPVVRISIGRIEVRAVSSPPPAVRPAPVRMQERLSLEEYLKPGEAEPMSNFLAIATVTAALKRVLQDSATQAVAGATVRPGRPEAPANGNAQPPGIDLYLYQVTPDAALRNDDLPTRRADGSLVQRPKVALDLHYLLAFRGDESALEPQRLLGNAARALHASPVITSSLIALAKSDFAFLAPSDLADAVELVKLAPLSLSLEELSKLWSVFFQIPYNLSVAYQATVVVIEGAESPQLALPVLERRLYVYPFQNAFIAEVASALGPGQPILAGGTLVLRGQRLRRDPMRVVVRGTAVDPSAASEAEVRVPLTVPPFPPGSIRAGVQGVAIVYPLLMGNPAVEHAGFESNAAAFVLRPRIIASAAPTASQVNVTVDPPVGKGQRAVLLLNRVPGSPPSAHVFTNPPAPADTATPSFAIAGVVAGSYFVRVQVDGAESPVVLDASNPAFGPTVSVP